LVSGLVAFLEKTFVRGKFWVSLYLMCFCGDRMDQVEGEAGIHRGFGRQDDRFVDHGGGGFNQVKRWMYQAEHIKSMDEWSIRAGGYVDHEYGATAKPRDKRRQGTRAH